MTAMEDPSKHVLVVEDSEEVVALFRDILEDMGHWVTATTYGPDDLAQVIKVVPDLVILDLMVDGGPVGWQLLQKMRMSPATESIPVVVCTAATQHVREQEAWLTTSRVTVILKPFAVDDLELAVNKALQLVEILPDRTGRDLVLAG